MANTGLPPDANGGRGLPLFPDLEHSSLFNRRAYIPFPFEDPLLRKLVRSRPLRRLRRIGFLGAVDRCQPRNRHSRYDHSVDVARLALLYAGNRNLSQHDTRILAVAGLLHDVGHGPLSHTLEPIFKSQFGISHHKAGVKIIRGESSLGSEIPELLTSHGLDPYEINAMIDGTHDSRYAFLFSGPINLDTIEGVTRCHAVFLPKRPEALSAAATVRALSEAETLPTGILDSFWQLKHNMYNFVIHDTIGLLYDGLAQAIVTQDIDSLSPSDFLKDDRQLRRDKRRLFKFLDRVRKFPDTLRKELPDSILNHEIEAPIRIFPCDKSVELKTFSDLAVRYRQKRTLRRIQICELLPPTDPTNYQWQGTLQEF